MLYILNHVLIKHKKIFEYFSCFWKVFLFGKISKNPKIFNSVFLATHSRVMLVVSLLKSSRDFLVSETPSCEKYLENFQKISGLLPF